MTPYGSVFGSLSLSLYLSLWLSLWLSLTLSGLLFLFVFWCVVGVWIVWLCWDGRCEACQLLMAPLSGALTTSNKNSMSRDVGQLWHAPAFVCATHVQTSRKLRNVVESCANIGKVKNLWINLNLRIWEQKENSLENSNFVENPFFLYFATLVGGCQCCQWITLPITSSLCWSTCHCITSTIALPMQCVVQTVLLSLWVIRFQTCVTIFNEFVHPNLHHNLGSFDFASSK